MKYHAPSQQFTVEHKDIQMAADSFIYAIRHIRLAAGLPLTRYKSDGAQLQDHDHAMKGIIDGAKSLGIDLGAEWGEDLDVSKGGGQ